jgi:hypothetical protein
MAGARELKKHTLAEVDRVVVRARAVGGATTLFFILSLRPVDSSFHRLLFG